MGGGATFRRIFEWRTYVDPLGNNGLHNAYFVNGAGDPPPADMAPTALGFERWTPGDGWGGGYASGPARCPVQLSNVHVPTTSVRVSNTTNLDYFKYNPDGEAALRAPTLTFRIEDADIVTGNTYRCYIKYRKTGGGGTFDTAWANNQQGAESRAVWETRSAPGLVTVNLSSATPEGASPGQLTELDTDWFGTLTFDIWVDKYSPTGAFMDGYMLKGPHSLWVPEPDAPDGKPGHEAKWVTRADGVTELRGHYWLHDDEMGRPASELALVPMDPELVEREPVRQPLAPLSVSVRHDGVDEDGDAIDDWIPVYRRTSGDARGTWRVLWTGADSSGPRSPERRTHDARRMLVANQQIDAEHPALVVRGARTQGTYPGGLPVHITARLMRDGGYTVDPAHQLDFADEPDGLSVKSVFDSWWGLTNTDYAPIDPAAAVDIGSHCRGPLPQGDGITPGGCVVRIMASGPTTHISSELPSDGLYIDTRGQGHVSEMPILPAAQCRFAHMFGCFTSRSLDGTGEYAHDGGAFAAAVVPAAMGRWASLPNLLVSKGGSAVVAYSHTVELSMQVDWYEHLYSYLTQNVSVSSAVDAARDEWRAGETPNGERTDFMYGGVVLKYGPDRRGGFTSVAAYGNASTKFRVRRRVVQWRR